jgi:hypothetical protein
MKREEEEEEKRNCTQATCVYAPTQVGAGGNTCNTCSNLGGCIHFPRSLREQNRLPVVLQSKVTVTDQCGDGAQCTPGLMLPP